MERVRVGVIGATGYVGQEAVRLLARHPRVDVTVVTSETYQGRVLGDVYPSLGRFAPQVCSELDPVRVAGQADVVLTALPHGLALKIAPAVLGAGPDKKLIDFGADFRLRDASAYQAWYKHEHTRPEWLRQAAYGLPELFREEVRAARLVANPGCYPTASALGARPLLERGLIDPDTLVIDAKSGVSGAGRAVSLGVHFAEVNENLKAYNIAGAHRHTPEIEQTLSRVAGREVRVSFTPHLIPMTRGILATIYAKLTRPVSGAELAELYRDTYRGEPFVQICAAGVLPETKQVYGSNTCRIGVAVDERTQRAIVVSVIDNLVKGAAGQAVQNLNLMCGFEETLGLDMPAIYP